MTDALTRAEVRRVDRLAIEELGLPGIVLMENASAGAARFLAAELDAGALSGPIVLLCGGGNNGGDGYALARHLANDDRPVRIYALKPADELPPDAARNREVCERMGLAPVDVAQLPGPGHDERAWLERASVIVEALCGTGARGAPREPLGAWIRAANASPARRLAIDLPAGLDADTGAVADPTFRADWTTTFVAPKAGFAAPAAAAVLGRVVVVPIGVPAALVRRVRAGG